MWKTASKLESSRTDEVCGCESGAEIGPCPCTFMRVSSPQSALALLAWPFCCTAARAHDTHSVVVTPKVQQAGSRSPTGSRTSVSLAGVCTSVWLISAEAYFGQP